MKIVVASHNNLGTRIILSQIFRNVTEVEFLIVETTGIFYKKSLFFSILKLLKEASFKFCLYRFFDLFIFKIQNSTLEVFIKNLGHKYYKTDDINRDVQIIKNFEPDLMVMLFTMHIAKTELIAVPKSGCLGCHPSDLESYRGLETFFWQLANNETTGAVSVYYLEDRIDSGKIIAKRKYHISSKETVTSHYKKLSNVLGNLLSSVLKDFIEKGVLPRGRFVKEGSYFPMPTRESFRQFRKLKRTWR
jgi:folate-dependent phosphoribosylglycinamide formyltransferase PurN